MGKNVKWKYEPYAFYNKAGIEERLTEMAEQGWFIEKMGFFWKYRKGEPVKRTYNVVYMEDPDNAKKENRQREFVEYCEVAGWELVCVKKDMLIFCHDGENPVPIETDVEMELESIDKVMRESYLQTYTWWVLWCFIQVVTMMNDYKEKPFYVMAQPLNLITIVIIISMLFFALDGWFYLSWMKKAKQYAKDYDTMLPTTNHFVYKSLADWIKVAIILWMFSTVFIDFDLILCGFILVFGAIVAMSCLSELKKNERRKCFLKGDACKIGRKEEVFIALITIIIVWCCFAFSGSDMSTEKDLAKAPVSLRDLMVYSTDVDEHVDYYTNESLLAKYIYLDHGITDDYGLELQYAYGKMKINFLYEKGKEAFFSEEEVFLPSYKAIDAASYGTIEAYFKPIVDDEVIREEYVFVWEDSFATVRFNNEPTDEQVKIVAEKLGNIE